MFYQKLVRSFWHIMGSSSQEIAHQCSSWADWKLAGDVPIKRKTDLCAQQKQSQTSIQMEAKVSITMASIAMRHRYESQSK